MKIREMFSHRFQNQNRGDEFGFSNRYEEGGRRVLNKDGSFNVRKTGGKRLAFHTLMTMSWPRFIFFVVAYYSFINLVFACIYLIADFNGIGFTSDYQVQNHFLIALFFSAQTLTTVGYGSLYPLSGGVSFIAAVEALFGLLMFAVFTGLMYGRVSRPVHGIRFSKNALIAPYKDGWSFQFRIANEMNNNLLELKAQALLSIVIAGSNRVQRQFLPLALDNGTASYLPLNWTLVHAITEDSPIYGMNADDFADGNVEILVMIKGFNDTFSQEVHARSSYKFEEIRWHKKFQLPYSFADDGFTLFELEKLDAFDDVAVAVRASAN